MAGGRKSVVDVREMIRRLKLGHALREIAREMGVHRKTLRTYRRVALEKGWLGAGELPPLQEIQAALHERCPAPLWGPPSLLEPYRERIVQWRRQGIEIKAIYYLLKDEHGFQGSYSSLHRFVRKREATLPVAFVRVETPAGEEAQVDFGFVGHRSDPTTGQPRKAWVFVMILSFSRHMYAEVVLDQKVETWIRLHEAAFEFFGGVPKKIKLDNLRAAVTRACFYEPEIQRAYAELATHYGFTIAPCRVRTPEHKGKVEQGGIHYVKRNALAGRTFKTLAEENAYLKNWILTRAAMRDHGTTHEAPRMRFEEIEKAALLSLPPSRYEIAVYKKAKLHPDCHVVFDKAYYSAPHRLIGQELLVRATADRVELYFNHERLATHPRARRPGERLSNDLHYPSEKLAGALAAPVRLKQQAQAIGPATSQLIDEMLREKPVDRLRAAMGVLRLAKKHGPKRLEAACRRARLFGRSGYHVVFNILRQGLDQQPLPSELHSAGPVPKQAAFARPGHQIAASLWRTSWN